MASRIVNAKSWLGEFAGVTSARGMGVVAWAQSIDPNLGGWQFETGGPE
jgi:hypothetical protein